MVKFPIGLMCRIGSCASFWVSLGCYHVTLVFAQNPCSERIMGSAYRCEPKQHNDFKTLETISNAEYNQEQYGTAPFYLSTAGDLTLCRPNNWLVSLGHFKNLITRFPLCIQLGGFSLCDLRLGSSPWGRLHQWLN